MDAPLVALIVGSNLTFLAFIAFFLHLRSRRAEERERRRAEVTLRVVERFDSPEELSAFLASAEGRELVDGIAAPVAARPLESLAWGLKVGLVAIFGGIAFLIGSLQDPGFLLPGLLGVLCGIGLLVAAAVTQRLARSWGLVPGAERAGRERPSGGGASTETSRSRV